MGNIWKRLLSLTLAMVMVLGMVPVQVFATETGAQAAVEAPATEPAATETTQASQPQKDSAVESVQALLDALPGGVGSEEEAEALNAALAAITEAIGELTTEQSQQLNLDNYYAAATALEQWYAQDYSEVVLADTIALENKDSGTIGIDNLNNKNYDAPSKYSHSGYQYRKKGAEKWETANAVYSRTVTLEHNVEYEVQERYLQYGFGKAQYSPSYIVVLKIYHTVSAALDANVAAPEAAGVTVANDGKVYQGESATISVTPIDGYKAEVYQGDSLVATLSDDNWTYTTPAITSSLGYTVKYVSTSAQSYNVGLIVNYGAYGDASLAKRTGITGDKVALTITPSQDTESAHHYYTVEVTGEGASYDKETGLVEVGTSDVSVTVTFVKNELITSKTDSVKFNGYLEAAQQMSGQTDYADVKTSKHLEQAILDALGVQFKVYEETPEDVEATDVTIQYLPYYYSSLTSLVSTEGFSQEKDAKNLSESAPDDTWIDAIGTGSKYYDFGQRFRDGDSDAKEKVIITYTLADGKTLSVTREISLTEGRMSRKITYTKGDTAANPVPYESADKLEEAIKANVTLSDLNWDGITLTTGTLPDPGATAEVTVTVTTDNGDATCVPTTSFPVWVKAPDAAANVTISVTGNGTVTFGNLTESGTLAPGSYALTATPSGESDYLDSVIVTCGSETVSKNPDGNYTLEGGKSYTVAVTFKSLTLKEESTIFVNKYALLSADTRIAGLKGKILTAVVGEDAAESDYTVTIKSGLSSYSYDLDALNELRKGAVSTWLASNDSITVTVAYKGAKATTAVKLADSRQDAVIALNKTAFTANTLDDLKTQIKNAVVVTDSSKNDITSSAGVRVELAEDSPALAKDAQTYTVTVKLSIGGETWLAAQRTTTVQATLAKYTITWNAGEGAKFDGEKASITTEQYYGETVVAPESEPAKEPTVSETYAFSRWNGLLETTTVTGEMSFTATFTPSPRKYTVTWDAGEGTFGETGNTDTTEVAYGGTPSHEAPTAPAGMSFEKWEVAESSKANVNDDGTIKGAVTYIAQYTNDTIYEIKWNAGEGKLADGNPTKTDSINLTKNPTAVITAPAAPSRTDYVFTGWLATEGEQKIGDTPTANGTFTAQWAPDANKNGVDDTKETLTIKIEGAGEGDMVKIGSDEVQNGDSYIFDSTKKEGTLTITATPVVENKLSQTYIVSMTNVGDVTYGKNYVASASFQPENGMEITVTFGDASFDLKETRVLNYYPGMDGVTNQHVYEAAVNSPGWNDDATITVEYLARSAQSDPARITIANLKFSDNPYLDKGIKSALEAVFGTEIVIDQTDTWVALEEDLSGVDFDSVPNYEEMFNDILAEKLASITLTNAIQVIREIIEEIQDTSKYSGGHAFGSNLTPSQDIPETIRLTYTDKQRNIQTTTVITLHDFRTPTQLVGNQDATLTYRDFKDADLATLLNLQVQTVDGQAIADQTIEILDGSLEEKNVSDSPCTITFRFKGNETYKPSKASFQVTIAKAPATMDIANVVTTYGSDYTMNHNVVPGNAYGDKAEIEASLIKFVVGLDVADLSVGESGITGTNTVVQLMLPESLKTGIDSITGELFKDGVEMSLSDLLKALELIDADSLGVLKQALEAITSIAGAGDLTIKLGGQLPKNVGTYLYGAVSTSGNYETVLDVAYIIIQPDAQQVYLDWNHNATNGLFTDSMLQYVDLGASAFDDEAFEVRNADATAKVRNLFFGVNKGADNKPALVLKLYNAGIDPKTFDKELGNGGFTQMAFIVDFGNTMHYAIPIVRAFAIVPNTVKVQISDDENTNFRRTYDGEKQALTVTVNGEVPESGLEVRYVGVTTKGKTYNSVTAPTDAGAYVVTAIYRAHDANGKLTGIGMDVKNLLVLPAQTETTVDDAVVTVGETVKLENIIHVTAMGNPDMTILTAQLATDGSFSEIGMDAISGNVNVDFPQWVDSILAENAPEIYQGVTVGQLSDILNGKIKSALEGLDLGAELTKSLTDILDQLNATLNNLPVDATVTFHDTDATAFSQVGIYLVGAMVTDSNYRVSADYGLVVVKPSVRQVYLDWNYHDNNGIWTEDLLRKADLYASAYTDPEFLYKDEEATKSITHTFLTVDTSGNVKVFHKADELRHGAYLELAYIQLKVDGTITLSDLIARPLVTVPNTVKVEFVDKDSKVTYDGNPHEMPVRVTKNGVPVTVLDGELTVTYRGVTASGEIYNSQTAPTDVGIYTVTAVYAKYDGETLLDCGAAVGALTILPATAAFSVTGGIIPWDGAMHGVTVAPDTVEYTLVSATAAVGKDLTEAGFQAISSNVNVDFPQWVDAILEQEHPKAYAEGIDAKLLIEKLQALNLSGTWVDSLVALLEKVPAGCKVTFLDNIQFQDPGVYVFAGFLTDFNYVPASDTALLVIQKKDSGLTFQNTEVYYTGKAQSVNVTYTEETDYVTVIVDRERNIGNILFEDDLTAVKNLLEKALGYTLPDTIHVTTLMNTINKAIDDVAAWEHLPADVKGALEQLKELVSTLPQTGTLYIDGDWRPVDVGEYEFYGISLSPVYQTKRLSAKLTIKPAEVTITVADQEIYFGDTEPSVKADVTVPHGEVSLSVTVTRKPGTAVGEYPYQVSYQKSANYTVTEKIGKLTIKPAEVTITVADQEIYFGDTEPSVKADVTVPHGEVSLSVTVTRKPGTAVGEYPYQVSYQKSANYTVTEKIGKLTIKAKDVNGENNQADKYPIYFNPQDQQDTIKPGATVEIDGQRYTLDSNSTAWVNKETKVTIAQTFAYHQGEDALHTYPTHMYVWYLTFVDGEKPHYDAQLIPELTDFFQYHGTSIRVNFKSNGIRFISSVNDKDANALMKGSLIRTKVMEGFRMTQAGTLFKWGEAATTTLINGDAASSLVYGIAGESGLRVFQKANGRNWFTGMLTNLGTDKETLKKDLVSRPYAVLERNGETITIYGGTIQRNIYYVAKQNENWQVGTVYNDYIKNIIRTVENP